MLFIFRGHNGAAVRAVAGAVLLVVGLVLPHGAVLVGIGAVLLAWGGIGALAYLRSRRRERIGAGRMS